MMGKGMTSVSLTIVTISLMVKDARCVVRFGDSLRFSNYVRPLERRVNRLSSRAYDNLVSGYRFSNLYDDDIYGNSLYNRLYRSPSPTNYQNRLYQNRFYTLPTRDTSLRVWRDDFPLRFGRDDISPKLGYDDSFYSNRLYIRPRSYSRRQYNNHGLRNNYDTRSIHRRNFLDVDLRGRRDFRDVGLGARRNFRDANFGNRRNFRYVHQHSPYQNNYPSPSYDFDTFKESEITPLKHDLDTDDILEPVKESRIKSAFNSQRPPLAFRSKQREVNALSKYLPLPGGERFKQSSIVDPRADKKPLPVGPVIPEVENAGKVVLAKVKAGYYGKEPLFDI